MANIPTHIYIAKQAQKLLPESLRLVTEKYQFVYNIGSMGGDVLYGLRELKDKDMRYANELHATKIYETFAAFSAALRAKPSEVKLAYTLGYMSHYVTDRNYHAYVNGLVENYLPRELPAEYQSVSHSLVESAGDAYVVREVYGQQAYRIIKDAAATKKQKNEIAELYKDALNALYGKTLNAKMFRRSMYLMILFVRLTRDPKGRKWRFYDRLERKLGTKKQITGLIMPPYMYGKIDYLNLERRPYRAVRNEPATVNWSAPEIMAHCAEMGADYIMRFMADLYGEKPLVKEDFDVNFEGVRIF